MTLGEALTLVRSAGGYAADIEAEQISVINEVQRWVCKKRDWSWLYATAAPTVTAGDPKLALPADLHGGRVVGVAVRHPSVSTDWGQGPLTGLGADEHRRLYMNDTNRGRPLRWAGPSTDPLAAGTTRYVWLHPVPDLAYFAAVRYQRSPADLAVAGDVLLVPDAHADIVAWGTIQRLALRDRDWNLADRAGAEYVAELRDMVNDDKRHETASRPDQGRVVDSGAWSSLEVGDQWPM